jgi:hypothetical protein
MEKLISLSITIMLLASFAFVALPVRAQTTVVKMIPASEDATYVGQLITFAGVVEDVTSLAGVGFTIQWNTTYLDYDSHTMTMPVEDFPGVQPPSPYAGLIHQPELIVADTPNPGAGTYDAAASTLGGSPFDGDGTAFVITLEVIDVPFDEDVGYVPYIDLPIEFTLHDLADENASSIPHTVEHGNVRLIPQPFVVPPLPLFKVMPETIECNGINESVTADVFLMGADHAGLNPYWDPAGIDVYMTFDTSMVEALSVTVDPDGWFESFFGGLWTVAQDIDNGAGTVHVAFLGYGNHTTPVSGTGRLFSVEFNSLTESDTYPPGTSQICLENPHTFTGEYVFDSIGGLIDTANPVGTEYNMITNKFLFGHYEMTSWEDNGDGMLSEGDQFVLLDTTSGFYFDYYLSQITGTLNCTLARTTDPIVWATNSISLDGLAYNGLPGRLAANPSGAAYSGFGSPYWTGNFSLTYPVASVNTITVHALPFTGDEYTYTLTENVDFKVHADDDLIEILNPLDVDIINECWTDGVNNSLNGWPYINYVASGISSVYVDFNNGTSRFALNNGFQMGPPGEWWYEPDWPWELEGWWALGYVGGPETWPAGSTWWVNYTAASYMEIDYNTDPTTAYVEFDGTYADFLALTDPTNTTWNERYPYSWNSYTWTGFVDDDTSGDLTVGDFLEAPGGILYRVDGVATDLITMRKPWICEDDPSDTFFGMAPIVSLAGFPQPDNSRCPWHNKEWSVQLPHVVECATYEECFKPSGGFIDIYTQYPDPYGGQGLNNPSDMFWPQKGIWICANVTYAQWPEQNKDVAFEVIDPQGSTWGIYVNRTNDIGVTCVFVRMPWPCDDPETYIGEWCVIATVDVACTIVNDTMCFKYDYKVNIWNATVDKDTYKHCENITVHFEYGSYAMQNYSITFAITAVDASGVPFGYAYETVVIGGAEYCTYKNNCLDLAVHVAKFARPPIGTIYVAALNGLPHEGGSAESPVFTIVFSIEAAWAPP